MSQADLDAMFTASLPGDIPCGEAMGTAIIAALLVGDRPPGSATRFAGSSPTMYLGEVYWSKHLFDFALQFSDNG